eukprot:2495120-Pyramimonas_sp.AAC.1
MNTHQIGLALLWALTCTRERTTDDADFAGGFAAGGCARSSRSDPPSPDVPRATPKAQSPAAHSASAVQAN